MKTATIVRRPTTDEGTFGIITLWNGDQLYTGELPERGNARGRSCIPTGTYLCRLLDSPRFGMKLYEVVGVEGRSFVKIHKGNWCGDRAKGYRSDVDGCVILGTDIGLLECPDTHKKQMAVMHSSLAFDLFMRAMGGEDFKLTVR